MQYINFLYVIRIRYRRICHCHCQGYGIHSQYIHYTNIHESNHKIYTIFSSIFEQSWHCYLFFLNTVNNKGSIFFFQICRVPWHKLCAVLIQVVVLQELLSRKLFINLVVLLLSLPKIIHEIYPTLNNLSINTYFCYFSGVKAGVGFKYILTENMKNILRFYLILPKCASFCSSIL